MIMQRIAAILPPEYRGVYAGAGGLTGAKTAPKREMAGKE